MKHLTLVILLALAPLSWGENSYFCTLGNSVTVYDESESKGQMTEEWVISLSEGEMTVTRHGSSFVEPLKMLTHRDRFYTGRWVTPADKMHGLSEVIWLLDVVTLKARRVVLTDFSSRTERGKCTKI